ncbi:MAG: bifunctional [glutamate--ammonia ligase]-adenylyl-L-tyrosine phosphorylase/[glutamate--ammonia-ligase] adenylyltransferase [Alistipes senegalensis]|nr:bifunctional [glutamate--ammonia ligase]-adenylyl-L-tyrosine phosphorylase/[glutamate--ammonia-ligase] adenylyltransferase [Oxalobacter formigenes]MCM1280558.1 bifunctional [glutamate--ammonia ligase]-adenylyl-L-tyrosine phosphorylase/[glutamate--ammonia-ligase] adenylyltransferase [Alistipes senegalensis]
MAPSLLPATAASRFYMHWLNADQPAREKQIESLSPRDFSGLDFAALLKQETDAGFSLPRAMRRVRNLVVAGLICRDLASKADLNEVVSAMTAFAEFAVSTLLDALTKEMTAAHGVPIGAVSGETQELIVLGMGKLGGGELNVSSDIDLIFVYPENGETRTEPGQRGLSNQEFFTRLGKRLINALSEISEDGLVFRVDMALRPNGASGPLVSSINAVEQYFIVQGREWERYAWIKARALTGKIKDWEALKKVVLPFIYRRYLDYGVIDAIRDMHRQIRAEVLRQEKMHPERNNNVKLGRGGIREIEFLTQMFQLIRGGRDIAFRNRSTREMLQVLAEKRQIEPEVAAKLLESYTFLRNLEHRLQYLDDAQTHVLPSQAEDMARIAAMMGLPDENALFQALQEHRAFVAAQFDAIFSDKTAPQEKVLHQPVLVNQDEDEQLAAMEARLSAIGFHEAGEAARRILSLWKTARIQSLSDTSRSRLISLINLALPQITAHCAHSPLCLSRLIDFLESIARRAAYLSLLTEYPGTLSRVIRMMDASDWAARYLARHPILLDELLDARTLLSPPDWQAFTAELDSQLAAGRGDTERQMDILRDMHHAQLFRLLAQDLEGALTVERLADHLSRLADIMIEAVIREAWLAMPGRHTDTPRFAVIAYGKLGGKELGYASDLDLIFLYDDDHADAPVLYARLAQRFITWMTSPTSAGRLFDIDIALRPDGASGLMVSSLASFKKYQKEAAWTWEHQALTRARFCAGDKRIGEQFEAVRSTILQQPRDINRLKQDVFSIREKMHDAHPNHSQLFDLKHDTGGMIDIEFIVQYLILAHASTHPELTGNIGNIALLVLCGKIGLIPPEKGEAVAGIYRHFRRRQHQIRMQGAEVSRVETGEVEEEIACVKKLWDKVFTAA